MPLRFSKKPRNFSQTKSVSASIGCNEVFTAATLYDVLIKIGTYLSRIPKLYFNPNYNTADINFCTHRKILSEKLFSRNIHMVAATTANSLALREAYARVKFRLFTFVEFGNRAEISHNAGPNFTGLSFFVG